MFVLFIIAYVIVKVNCTKKCLLGFLKQFLCFLGRFIQPLRFLKVIVSDTITVSPKASLVFVYLKSWRWKKSTVYWSTRDTVPVVEHHGEGDHCAPTLKHWSVWVSKSLWSHNEWSTLSVIADVGLFWLTLCEASEGCGRRDWRFRPITTGL